jgi:hypothetical protein
MNDRCSPPPSYSYARLLFIIEARSTVFCLSMIAGNYSVSILPRVSSLLLSLMNVRGDA